MLIIFLVKILVIEDEVTLCCLYKLEFEDEGYEVVSSTTGDEGMKLFKNENPDLVTLDINLSVSAPREGLKLLEQMKAIKPKVPVILLTGYDAYSHDARAELADAYVIKDSKLEELKAAIRRLIASAHPK